MPLCPVEAVLRLLFWALKLGAGSRSAAPFSLCKRIHLQSAPVTPLQPLRNQLALPCPAGLHPTQEDQQLIKGGIQAARSAAEATVAEQQSLLQRLAEELQAQDIEHVRQACCSACRTSYLHLSPFRSLSLQQACSSAHHIICCALMHLQPLRGP